MQLCRQLKLFSDAMVAIDGSKFKAVNNRDRNYTSNKITRRREQIETSIARYLAAMESADRQELDIAEAKTTRLKDKIEMLKAQMAQLDEIEERLEASPSTTCRRRTSPTTDGRRTRAGKRTGRRAWTRRAVR